MHLTPKNGRFLVALMAGAPGDLYRELRPRLKRAFGMDVQYHWDYEKVAAFRRPIPVDVDVVLIMTSMLGHSVGASVINSCKADGVMFVPMTHKWVDITASLAKFANLHPGMADVDADAEMPPVKEETLRVRPVQISDQPAVIIRVENAHLYNNPSPMSKFLALLSAAMPLLKEAGVSAAVLTPEGLEIRVAPAVAPVAPAVAPVAPAVAPVAPVAPEIPKVEPVLKKTRSAAGSTQELILAVLRGKDTPMDLAGIVEQVQQQNARISYCNIATSCRKLYEQQAVVRLGQRGSYRWQLP